MEHVHVHGHVSTTVYLDLHPATAATSMLKGVAERIAIGRKKHGDVVRALYANVTDIGSSVEDVNAWVVQMTPPRPFREPMLGCSVDHREVRRACVSALFTSSIMIVDPRAHQTIMGFAM